jgi:hypothetical protein
MNTVRTAGLGLLSLVVLSCGSVAPIKVAAGDQCYRCRRSILSERVATETIDSNRFVSKFRGPGCMAKYLVAHQDQQPTIFVTDYSTGRMMAPGQAFYVSELVDRNTGEVEYRAYRQQADAEAFALETRAVPIGWDEVLERAR